MVYNICNVIAVAHVYNLILEEIVWENILKNNFCGWSMPRKTWRSLTSLDKTELVLSPQVLALG